MQSYETAVDPNLSFDRLSRLGSRLQLRDGRKFEVKTLSKDLPIDPHNVPNNMAHSIRNDSHDVYEVCRFDRAYPQSPPRRLIRRRRC